MYEILELSPSFSQLGPELSPTPGGRQPLYVLNELAPVLLWWYQLRTTSSGTGEVVTQCMDMLFFLPFAPFFFFPAKVVLFYHQLSPRLAVFLCASAFRVQKRSPSWTSSDGAAGIALVWIFVLELGIQRTGGGHPVKCRLRRS